jgi:hypothetical protein
MSEEPGERESQALDLIALGRENVDGSASRGLHEGGDVRGHQRRPVAE